MKFATKWLASIRGQNTSSVNVANLFPVKSNFSADIFVNAKGLKKLFKV